ncbi:leucine-rich repeats and immunoglobulin-like domains protein 3 [Palaemon carinicauda]|uniref:leucine-rich repeats and immunoglobulin-like domains protein 3 n=1 Tax=Palaemon carinicauda TaxID=392227 RepID=UPI0035B5B04C
MCSRRRKYLKKLQVVMSIVTCVTLVRSDELPEFNSLEDHIRIIASELRNSTVSSHREISPQETEQDFATLEDFGQKVTSGSSERSRCPTSCFCEEKVGYAACVGDGQWAPPALPSGLVRVELRGFSLPQIGPAQLKMFQGIRELQINHCNLSLLVDDSFASMQELDGLDLSDNQLTMLGPYSLQGLQSLRHLDISYNRLTVLNRPFIHLPSLQHLNLHHNSIRRLIQDTFQGLNRVQYIDLDSNEIYFLEVSAFQHLTSLAHLILSNNQLSSLATLDFFGSRLQYIDLSNIGITRIPQALTQFVRDLRLAKNAIREIHRGDLDSYPYLTLLVLDNNSVEVLEEDAIGRHEYLSRLWLNGNNLMNIPLSLPPSLQALYIDDNSISAIKEGDFRGLIHLQQLSLQNNNISVIDPCAFCELAGLKTLNLQGNYIRNLTKRIFSHLLNLETLDLSQNPLKALDGEALLGLASLRSLQMSHIQSDSIEIPDTLFDSLKGLWILEVCESPTLVSVLTNNTNMLHSLRGLRELNIMHNGLAQLRSDFPAFFPQLQVIKLSGNVWDCSSAKKIEWMRQWMQLSSINFYRSYSVRCSSPLSLSYKPVILLEEIDYNGSESESSSSESPMSTPVPLAFITHGTTYSLDGKSQINKPNAATMSNSSEISIASSVDDDSEKRDVSFQELDSANVTQESKPNLSDVTTVSSPVQFNILKNWTASSSLLVNFFTGMKKNETEDTSETRTLPEKTPSRVASPIPSMNCTTQSTPNPRKLGSSSTLAPITTSLGDSDSTTLPSPFLRNDAPGIKSSRQRSTTGDENTFSKNLKILLSSDDAEPRSVLRFEGSKVRKYTIKSSNAQEESNKSAYQQQKQQQMKKIVREFHSHRKDLWLYRGDSSHGLNQRNPGLSLGIGRGRVSDEAVVGAGIVATFLGVALLVSGFLLAQGRAKVGNSWDSSSLTSSYWRDGSGEDEVLMAPDYEGESNESSMCAPPVENGMEIAPETQTGLNKRLYLLLQRDSCTGITPESLPDPRTY